MEGGLVMSRYVVRGAVWVIVYLLFVLAPMIAMLAGSVAARA